MIQRGHSSEQPFCGAAVRAGRDTMLNPHDRRPIVAHWSGDRKKRMVPTGSAPVGGTGHPSIPAQDTPSMSSRSAVGARGVVQAARLALPGPLLFGGNHRGVGLGGWEAAGAAAGGCSIGQQGTERSSGRRQSLSSGEREHALDGALLSMTGPERALRLVPHAPGVLPPSGRGRNRSSPAAARRGHQSGPGGAARRVGDAGRRRLAR